MPIDVEALLQPISAENPSGADLRYDPLTDQIKEARRQDDDLNQGVWKRDLKTADHIQVIKLATQALTKRSKDLQIAAWLSEALLRREGIASFQQGLELMRRLLEDYWPTVYPQIDEDGELDLRATPLSWVASQLGSAIRSTAINQAGHTWYQYRESRAIPTEDEARADMNKQQRRNEAIADGAVTQEEFEKSFESTPFAQSQKIYDNLTGLLAFIADFGAFCDEKFGDASPDFGPLRTAIEEVQQTSRMLLIRKGGLQPTAPAPEPPPVEQFAPATYAEPAAPMSAQPQPSPQMNYAAAAAPAPAQQWAQPPVPQMRGGIDPSDFDDATERVLASARYLRREFPFIPMPYLLSRAVRWGELRATGGSPAPFFLEPPPSDLRVELKRLAQEGNWNDLRDRAEEAATLPCGRAWLDAQRYVVSALRFSGAEMAAQAILSELKSVLQDFPQITQWTLADDTPAANQETMQWLQENGLLPGSSPQPSAAPPPPPPPQPEWNPPPRQAVSEPADGEPAPPDAYDLAMEAARSGRTEEAFTILSREIAMENTGRGRFLRKIQLAQICLATGNDEIGRPILEELAEEIEHRKLDAWEGPDVIAQPLALLYRTLATSTATDEERRKLYARICRLDPARALSLGR